MSFVANYLLAGGVSILAGLDRTAAGQTLFSRPLVAASATGFLLDDFQTGMQVGILMELLWLGRLPVGASIPPDDTQIAVAGTGLAVIMGRWIGWGGLPMVLLSLLVSMPLGKVGQLFDRLARKGNERLLDRAASALRAGRHDVLERFHLMGLFGFAMASLATYLVIVSFGSLLVYQLAPVLMTRISSVLSGRGIESGLRAPSGLFQYASIFGQPHPWNDPEAGRRAQPANA
ncbi:MAG: PTS sugar transporter subunit IIC [Desulfuromonadaceae bacterium]